MKEVGNVVIVHVNSKKTGHIAPHPSRSWPEDDQRQYCGNNTINSSLDHKGSAHAHFGGSDQLHHPYFLFGNEDGQSNGIESNDDGNNYQKESNEKTKFLRARNYRAQSVYD